MTVLSPGSARVRSKIFFEPVIDKKSFFSPCDFFLLCSEYFLPSSPQQVGKIYLKVPRKCGIFGIHNEATRIQTNFIIDVADNAGKGSNSVIRMLVYYLDNNPADEVILFSDNCVGQNKNNSMMSYLLWRVFTKKTKKFR